MDELWYRLYCAVSRCNRALVSLERNGVAKLGSDISEQRIAEVKFLRAHFYYKLLIVFRQVPWIDEVAYSNNSIEQIPNDEFSYEGLFGKVIADFETAYNVLPEKQSDEGVSIRLPLPLIWPNVIWVWHGETAMRPLRV